VNASKARRRWLRWCRYVQKTQSFSNGKWGSGTHAGQAKAWEGAMFSKRYAPKGARYVRIPPWGVAR
jgi:hypothetical protein